MTQADKLIKYAMDCSDRRLFLCANAPICPICGTEQVQLIAYLDEDARWKCRKDKHVFIYEPQKV